MNAAELGTGVLLTAGEQRLLAAAPRVCHGCGNDLAPGAFGYCASDCRTAARLAVDLGVIRQLPEAWVAALRHAAAAERHHGAGTSTRTKQRKAKAATTAT